MPRISYIQQEENKMRYPKVIIKSEDSDTLVIEKEKIVCSMTTSAPPLNRIKGNLKDLGWWLSNSFEWNIVTDDKGELVLVCTKKS